MLNKRLVLAVLCLLWASIIVFAEVGHFYPGDEIYMENGAVYNISCETNFTVQVYTNASCLFVDNLTFCNASGLTNLCVSTVTTTTSPTTTTTLINAKVFRWNVSDLHVSEEAGINESFIEMICMDIYRGLSICYNITSNNWSKI